MCYVRGCAKSDNPGYDIPLRHHQVPANAAALALQFMLCAIAVVKSFPFGLVGSLALPYPFVKRETMNDKGGIMNKVVSATPRFLPHGNPIALLHLARSAATAAPKAAPQVSVSQSAGSHKRPGTNS